VSVIYVPRFRRRGDRRGGGSDLDLVICITEGIPVRDMIRTKYKMQGRRTKLVGPTAPA